MFTHDTESTYAQQSSYQNNHNSPWFHKFSKTQQWLQEEEELRLQNAKLKRPDTKWVYERTALLDVKVI